MLPLHVHQVQQTEVVTQTKWHTESTSRHLIGEDRPVLMITINMIPFVTMRVTAPVSA